MNLEPKFTNSDVGISCPPLLIVSALRKGNTRSLNRIPKMYPQLVPRATSNFEVLIMRMRKSYCFPRKNLVHLFI